jgi:pheromone shutdown protein TraB
MQTSIYNIDYSQLIHILGTTHFSRRSFHEACTAVAQLKPTDLAIELDMKRYEMLNSDCSACSENTRCTRKCEFIAAVEALGNRNTNIWLIDMSRSEFWRRMYRVQARSSYWRVLLHERDTLMAARLAWIATRSLKNEVTPKVLALVGASHEKGVKSLLRNPFDLRDRLKRLGLVFTPPTLIRRVMVD